MADNSTSNTRNRTKVVTRHPRTLEGNIPQGTEVITRQHRALNRPLKILQYNVRKEKTKLRRRFDPQESQWGTKFPVYTNVACIDLVIIYSTVAPLVLVFGGFAFAIFLGVFRNSMIFVIRPKSDTHGVLHQRALNQLFVGIYIMELYLVGLFALVRDEKGFSVCIAQAVLMAINLGLTMIFQYFLYASFGPLFQLTQLCSYGACSTSEAMEQQSPAQRHGPPTYYHNPDLNFEDMAIRRPMPYVWRTQDYDGVKTDVGARDDEQDYVGNGTEPTSAARAEKDALRQTR
ncbi:MAG: hypothetical protein Q9228_000993 [Teloschistes exilis]